MAKSCGATQPGADRFSYPSIENAQGDTVGYYENGAISNAQGDTVGYYENGAIGNAQGDTVGYYEIGNDEGAAAAALLLGLL